MERKHIPVGKDVQSAVTASQTSGGATRDARLTYAEQRLVDTTKLIYFLLIIAVPAILILLLLILKVLAEIKILLAK